MTIRASIGRQLVRLGLWLQGPATARGLTLGDRVLCQCAGSWVDRKVGTITALDVTSTDGIHGHAIQIDGHGWTVVDPAELRLVDPLAGRNYTIGLRPDGWSEVYIDGPGSGDGCGLRRPGSGRRVGSQPGDLAAG